MLFVIGQDPSLLWEMAAKAPYVAAMIVVVIVFLRYIGRRDEAGHERDKSLQATMERTGDKYETSTNQNTKALGELKGSIDLLDRSVRDLRPVDRAGPGGGV